MLFRRIVLKCVLFQLRKVKIDLDEVRFTYSCILCFLAPLLQKTISFACFLTEFLYFNIFSTFSSFSSVSPCFLTLNTKCLSVFSVFSVFGSDREKSSYDLDIISPCFWFTCQNCCQF